MNINNIKKLLSDFDQVKVDAFIKYCNKLLTEKKKDGGQWVNKNPWMNQRSDDNLADFYKMVAKDGLEFDGKHITLLSTGVSYDYVAYKNKMFLSYPETLIDVQLVHKNDDFSFTKDSGKVIYKHKINNPFGSDELIGCYCVIKNKRGEFLNTLNMEEINKHRKVAKTDFIWQAWFNEMVLKTVIKKACKNHFADIFQNMETLDNEQNDVEQSLDISIETKQELEDIKSVPDLEAYYLNNIGKNAGIAQDFVKACEQRKSKIVKTLSEADEAKEENADS